LARSISFYYLDSGFRRDDAKTAETKTPLLSGVLFTSISL
jgi:hypothetical protein